MSPEFHESNTGPGERYELKECIGAGGMGVVHAAFDHRLRRPVAIKLLDPKVADLVSVAGFREECRLLAQLSHPRVVRVFDANDDRLQIVMELLEGQCLDRYVLVRGVLPESELTPIIDGILEALEYTHSRGVLHRDLKPSNVFLRHGADVVLIDFGIARRQDLPALQTSSFSIVGTPSYLAPELISGEKPSIQSDLFSVAVIAFELLTGLGLHSGLPRQDQCHVGTIMGSLSSGVYLQLAHRALRAHPSWSDLLLRGLARNPQARFESATAFREQLAKIQTHDATGSAASPAVTVKYHQPDGAGQIPGAIRHVRRWAWLTTAVVTALVAAGIFRFAPTGPDPDSKAGVRKARYGWFQAVANGLKARRATLTPAEFLSAASMLIEVEPRRDGVPYPPALSSELLHHFRLLVLDSVVQIDKHLVVFLGWPAQLAPPRSAALVHELLLDVDLSGRLSRLKTFLDSRNETQDLVRRLTTLARLAVPLSEAVAADADDLDMLLFSQSLEDVIRSSTYLDLVQPLSTLAGRILSRSARSWRERLLAARVHVGEAPRLTVRERQERAEHLLDLLKASPALLLSVADRILPTPGRSIRSWAARVATEEEICALLNQLHRKPEAQTRRRTLLRELAPGRDPAMAALRARVEAALGGSAASSPAGSRQAR